jgi:L-iditol 2-dehydrogenase
MSTNEIDLKFLFRYRHTWPKAIMLTQTGAIDLAPLVTNTFRLEQAKEALESSADRSKFSMKTVIVDGDD